VTHVQVLRMQLEDLESSNRALLLAQVHPAAQPPPAQSSAAGRETPPRVLHRTVAAEVAREAETIDFVISGF
jgi:hypothetical protein